MKVLLDTHILISREYNRTVTRSLQNVFRLMNELSFIGVVHVKSLDQIDEDRNIPNKSTLISKIKTYPILDPRQSPYDDKTFLDVMGKPQNRYENVDCYLMHSVYRNEVGLLITEDIELLEKATHLHIQDKVLTLQDAANVFQKLLEQKESVHNDVPVFCFYKRGRKWCIGERGKEGIFDEMKGFEHIHYLICNEGRELEPFDIYHQGKASKDDYALSDIDVRERENLGIRPEVHQRIEQLTSRERKLLKEKLEQLQEEHESGIPSSMDESSSREEQIAAINKYLNTRSHRERGSESEKARLSVTKTIRRALSIISNDNSTTSVARYLNNTTIRTGDRCIYRPNANDKPIWILDQ